MKKWGQDAISKRRIPEFKPLRQLRQDGRFWTRFFWLRA
jgi:hypothetical protein